MTDLLYLAWRYLAFHKVKTTILIVAAAITIYIPTTLVLLVRKSENAVTARAQDTPLVMGARGSPIELVLASLYFSRDTQDRVTADVVDQIAATGLGLALPIHARFSSQGTPIIGTSFDYLGFRALTVANGRPFARIGECVVGAAAARRLNVRPGDHVMSSPETAFDIAGVYPLRMPVVGVLAPGAGPDDDAIFVDVKTAWIIEGLAHGHQDLQAPEARTTILRRDESNVTANASLNLYNEVTDDNLDSYHFHADPRSFPLTSVIVEPNDHKSQALLLARFGSAASPLQIVRPTDVVSDLMQTVFTVRAYVVLALLIVALATAIVMVLVFHLSIRLRTPEIRTMALIGCAQRRIVGVLGAEIALVVVLGVALGLAASWTTGSFGDAAIKLLVE